MISESIRRRFPLLLFTLAYLLFASWTYRDFGETFDESGVYVRGIALGHYLIHDDLLGFLHKSVPDDGFVIYDHFYSWVLSLLNPSSDLDNYHRLNLFFGLIAFILLFELVLSRVKDPWLALTGPIFLVFTPRFFGDIPANPKDMPFAVFYLGALALIYFFHQKPRISLLLQALLLGLAFGFTESSRLLGLSLYPVYVLFDLHFFYREKDHTAKEWKTHLFDLTLLLTVIFIVSSFFLVLTWPYLGANFFLHFKEGLDTAKNFFWNNNVLFMGQEIPAADLPWTYLPVWFLITTPLFILFFCAASFFFVRDKMKNPLYILMGIAVTVNVAFYLFFKPVLYDGLRHFLFLLPILVAIAALSAAQWVKNAKKDPVFKTILLLAGLNMALVLIHLVRLHPYEYIYFNELTGGLKGSLGRFDNDYWGASFKEAVDWLEKNETTDPKKTYKVNGSGNSYQIFYYFTPNMKWVDNIKDADYYISYGRDHKQDLADPLKLIHLVEKEGVPLNYIYKLK